MSLYGLDAALWHIYTSSENAALFIENADDYLDRFPLTPQERSAIRSRDNAALLDLGAHPFLMYKFALRLSGGFSMQFLQEYLRPIDGLELRDIVT